MNERYPLYLLTVTIISQYTRRVKISRSRSAHSFGSIGMIFFEKAPKSVRKDIAYGADM